MSVVKKRKHVSKKNKKDWRKYCDIKDVEDFLEDQRLEERLGKFENKPDEELFVVDTGAVEEEEVRDEKPILSAKLRKRAKLAQIPKCFEILQNSSKVPDPNRKRNHVNPVGNGPTALSKITERKKMEKGIFKKKVQLAKKSRQLELNKKRKAKTTNKVFKKDLWGQDSPDSKGIPESLNKEFISPEARLHNVPIQSRMRAKPPPPSIVVTRKAVEPPHPGVSYNPSFQAHQQLLQEVVQHENKMIKKEKHLHRVTTNMFTRVTPSERENQWREEMSAGLEKPSGPSADPDSEPSDNEYRAVNPPVQNKKKDHKTRRKQKERLQEKERLRREKVEKKKITDLYKLRQLQTAIKTDEQRKAEERKLRAEKRKAEGATAPPQLNAKRVPLKEPDFLPPEQLAGDLRSVSTGVNLLRERYESLQRRGALAPAVIMMKKRRKVKPFFKPGHKVTDDDINKYIKGEPQAVDKPKFFNKNIPRAGVKKFVGKKGAKISGNFKSK